MADTTELTKNDLERMQENAGSAAQLLRSMSHPARLMILCNLAGSAKCVSELCVALDMGQAQMSQQLARLRQDQLVTVQKVGREHHYRIADPKTERLILVMYDLFCAQD